MALGPPRGLQKVHEEPLGQFVPRYLFAPLRVAGLSRLPGRLQPTVLIRCRCTAIIVCRIRHSAPPKNPPGHGDGIVRPECPHPFAGAEPCEPARAENVGRPPSEIERQPRPFVEKPAGVIHGPEPFGLGYMPRLSDLEGRPCVGIGWRHSAILNRDGRALGHVKFVDVPPGTPGTPGKWAFWFSSMFQLEHMRNTWYDGHFRAGTKLRVPGVPGVPPGTASNLPARNGAQAFQSLSPHRPPLQKCPP